MTNPIETLTRQDAAEPRSVREHQAHVVALLDELLAPDLPTLEWNVSCIRPTWLTGCIVTYLRPRADVLEDLEEWSNYLGQPITETPMINPAEVKVAVTDVREDLGITIHVWALVDVVHKPPVVDEPAAVDEPPAETSRPAAGEAL